MFWKFTLTDPGNNVFSPSEPYGWEDSTINLERHSEFHSLIETFTSSFQTYGSNGEQDGGRDWLLNVENTYGADALIQILVQIDNNESGTWETLFQGNLGISLFIESLDTDHFLQIVFAQQDFWAKFIARYSTQVDIRANQSITEKAQNQAGTITPTPYFNLPLPSQKINKSFNAFQKYNKTIQVLQQWGVAGNWQNFYVDFDTPTLNEINEKFTYGLNGINLVFGEWTLAEKGTFNINALQVTIAIPLSINNPLHSNTYYYDNHLGSAASQIDVFLQINSQPPIILLKNDTLIPIPSSYLMNNGDSYAYKSNIVTQYYIDPTKNWSFNLNKNDSVKIYGSLANYEPSGNTPSNVVLIFGELGWGANDLTGYFWGAGYPTSGSKSPNDFLQSASYYPFYDTVNPSNTPYVDPNTLLPTNRSNGSSIQIFDTWIVGRKGNPIGGIQYDVGWFIQAIVPNGINWFQYPANSSPSGGITGTNLSNIVNGTGTNFNAYIDKNGLMVLYNNSSPSPSNFIGIIKKVNSNTQLTLTSNAKVSFTGSLWCVCTWWVSPVHLKSGIENYGKSLLDVTFESEADYSGNSLFSASGTNAYSLTASTVTSYTPGLSLYVQFQNNNTGASTLNVNLLGPIPIVHLNGSPCVANDIVSILVASGTNAYTLSYPTITQLIVGASLTVKFTNASSAACTLSLNSFGAIPIYYKGSQANVGQIASGAIVQLVYDGNYWQIQDNNGQQVQGMIYVLIYDGINFVISLISSTDQINPTANNSCQAFLSHDIIGGVLDRITDTPNLIYSEYLGNQWTSKQYPSTGCGSLLANMKGLHLRGYTLPQKPFFISAQDWWDGINPIHNLGLGYDVVGGNNVIRIEEKSYFYNPTMSVLFSNVQKIKRAYDTDNQFNAVTIGYQKWQSQAATGVGAPSGIDDPQSSRNYSTLFKIIGKPIQLLSKWIAASLTIETTRRLGVMQSANYMYDDDTFVIALKANGDGTFTPELNENFTTINNLTNPSTRYNTRLSPARNLLRWINFLSSSLQQYLTSFFTFTGGSGNYNMQTQINTSCDGDNPGVLVNESGSFSPSNTPLFIAQIFEIEHYLDWENYKLIKQNRTQAIGISQTSTGHVPFFIKTLSYNVGRGVVKLTAWPLRPFTIQVIDSPASEEIINSTKYYERPGYDPGFYE